MRNIKTLSFVFAAVIAVSAVAASIASAQQGTLTSDGPAVLDMTETAGKVNALTAFGAKVECPASILTVNKTLTTKETDEGKKHKAISFPATSATITLHFLQANCKAIEGGTTHKATVTTNGCDVDVRVTLRIAGGIHFGLKIDIVCPTNNDIEVEVYPFAGSELGGVACTLTVKPQTELTGGSVQTNAAADDLEVEGSFTGIAVSRSGFGCATEETKAAVLDLNTTTTGTNEAGGATGITVTE